MLSSPDLLDALRFDRPGALWIGLALLPILVLYFLRMRFRRKPVGSNFLWRSLSETTSGGEALRRRSLLLLLLQVAAVALAAFAAAGPSIVSNRLVAPGVALILDASASMGTRDCPGTAGSAPLRRIDAAVQAAMREIDGLAGDVPIAAFACSASARPLLSGPTFDKAAAKAALRGLEAGSESFDEAACAEGISAWLSRNEGSWSARLFTDGGPSLGGERLSAAFDGAFGYESVGSSGASVGATGLRIEATAGAPRAVFTLWNGFPAAKEVRVSVRRDASTIGSALLGAAPGWSRAGIELGGIAAGDASNDGAAPEGSYELAVQRGPDSLADAPGESYYLSISARRSLSVLLVGRSDPFIKAALAYEGIAYSAVAEIPPAGKAQATGIEDADIVIFDSAPGSAPPPAGLRRDLLVFGVPPPDAPIASSGTASGPIAATSGAGTGSHPLSRFVSWEGAIAGAGMGYELRGQAVVLATAGGKPSVVAWEKDGYRNLAIGIDLARSDLGLKSAFPVLLQNYLEWCAPRVDDQSAYTLVAGEGARRLEPDSFRVAGKGAEIARDGPSVTITAREAGLFEWDADSARGYLAINVPASELDSAARPLRTAAVNGAAASSASPTAPATGAEGATAGSGAGSALAASLRSKSTPLGALASALLALCLAAEWLAWSSGSKVSSSRMWRRIFKRKARGAAREGPIREGRAREGGLA